MATFSEGWEESITICVATGGSSHRRTIERCRDSWERGKSIAGQPFAMTLFRIFQYSFPRIMQFPAWQPFFPMTQHNSQRFRELKLTELRLHQVTHKSVKENLVWKLYSYSDVSSEVSWRVLWRSWLHSPFAPGHPPLLLRVLSGNFGKYFGFRLGLSSSAWHHGLFRLFLRIHPETLGC